LDDQSKEGDTHVSSNFVVFQTRIDIADHLFYGKRDDLLRQVDGEWKIAGRRVVVDKSPLPNVISIFF
jgi:3-phenylpropionate/cinnamic acid dioxygenase small subunit